MIQKLKNIFFCKIKEFLHGNRILFYKIVSTISLVLSFFGFYTIQDYNDLKYIIGCIVIISFLIVLILYFVDFLIHIILKPKAFIITFAIIILVTLFSFLNDFIDIISIFGSIIIIFLVDISKQNNSNIKKSRCDYYYNKCKNKLERIKFNEMYFDNKINTYSKLLNAYLLTIILGIIISKNVSHVPETPINIKFDSVKDIFCNINSILNIKDIVFLIEKEIFWISLSALIFAITSMFFTCKIDKISRIRKKPLSERYDENSFDADFINLFNSTIPEDLREYFGEYTEKEIKILEGNKKYNEEKTVMRKKVSTKKLKKERENLNEYRMIFKDIQDFDAMPFKNDKIENAKKEIIEDTLDKILPHQKKKKDDNKK